MALADSTVQQLSEEYLPSRRLPPPKLQNRKIESGSVAEAKGTVAINRGGLRTPILNTHGDCPRIRQISKCGSACL